MFAPVLENREKKQDSKRDGGNQLDYRVRCEGDIHGIHLTEYYRLYCCIIFLIVS